MSNTKQTKPIKRQNGKTNKTELLPIIPGRIGLTNIRGARRLLSRLITGFINKDVEGPDAKCLTYLLSTYVNITRDDDFEKRLQALEEIMRAGK
jgi:hypothetical protein